MSIISAVHTLRQCGYSVACLPARAGRPHTLWLVRRSTDWAAHTLPAGGRLVANQLVAFAAALP